ncbi:mitochondrial dicarboxylate carrier-like [Oscarella lobularis]|uniref:mitochondrial dicarboxylate carrier-like n=1 Tax=Oscarella lobularis TaxID=121494 RepID=UPI003313E303
MSHEGKKRQKWFVGGLAGSMAACFTHPLDLVKVQLQTQQKVEKGMVRMTIHVVKNQGFLGLYRGLSASITRQMTYTTTRFAIYEFVRERILAESGREEPLFHQKIVLATVGGFFGGIAGNPADLVNVRMQNDAKLPKSQQRGYRNIFHGAYLVGKEEGIRALWSGVSMNIARSILMTIGQISVYDQAKQGLLGTGYFKENIMTHLTASIIAGFASTVLTQPADVMKTRMMNSPNGLWFHLKNTAAMGPLGFFKGFVPALIRLSPHTILLFLFLEQLRKVSWFVQH